MARSVFVAALVGVGLPEHGRQVLLLDHARAGLRGLPLHVGASSNGD